MRTAEMDENKKKADELSYKDRVQDFCRRNRDKIKFMNFELLWCVQPLMFSFFNRNMYQDRVAERKRSKLEQGFYFLIQYVYSLVSLAVMKLKKERYVLLFTHAVDIDDDGCDPQMGPLADEMKCRRKKYMELVMSPFDGTTLRCISAKRKPFVFYSFFAGASGKTATEAFTLENDGVFHENDLALIKRALARINYECMRLRLVFSSMKPGYAFIIDECGSGRPLVLALKSLGVLACGVQHGASLGAYNLEYMGYGYVPNDCEAPVADKLFVWGEYFRRKLLANSHIFTDGHVVVAGQLRQDYLRARGSKTKNKPAENETGKSKKRVLFFSQYLDSLRADAVPFLRELAGHDDFCLTLKKHPEENSLDFYRAAGVDFSEWTQSLYAGLEWADAVVSVSSTSLLEAGLFHKPAIVLLTDTAGDRLDIVKDGLCPSAGTPQELVKRLLEMTAPESAPRAAETSVWCERDNVAKFYADYAEGLTDGKCG